MAHSKNEDQYLAFGDVNQISAEELVNLRKGVKSLNFQTGTSYQLALSDSGKIIILTNSAAISILVPLNNTVPFSIGTRIDLIQGGTGKLNLQIQLVGIVIKSRLNYRFSNGQNSIISLIKADTNTWYLVGDLSILREIEIIE